MAFYNFTFKCFFIIFSLFYYIATPTFLFSKEIKPSIPFQVLIIHSSYESYKWTDSMQFGIRDVLENSSENIEFWIEYIDSKRNKDTLYYEKLYELFKVKYNKKKIDLIITGDNEAFKFISEKKNKLFEQTPIIFAGYNNFKKELFQNKTQVTGVVENNDIKATIDTALQLHPKTEKVVFLAPGAPSKRMEWIAELPDFYASKVEVITIVSSNLNDIDRELEKLGSNIIVIPLNSLNILSKKYLNFIDFIKHLTATGDFPVYALWDIALGHGIVGGKLVGGELQGRSAAFLALEILRGKSVSDIPIVMNSPNQFMFDWKQLNRFNISLNKLPINSKVINKPFSFYETYETLVNLISIFVIILIIILIILLYNIKIRKRADRELKITNFELKNKKDELETIIQESPNPMLLHEEGGNILMINRAWSNSSGFSIKDTPTIEDWIIKTRDNQDVVDYMRKHINLLYEITETLDEGEFSFFNKNRELVTWKVSSAPLGLINGKRTIITSAMDITELKHNEKILIQQSRLASIGEMLDNIAHQWRQPLSAISTASTGVLVEKEAGILSSDDLISSMNSINDATQYLSSTIDYFRNFLVSSDEKKVISFENTIGKTIKILSSKFKNREINVVTNIDNISYPCIENEMIQVIMNLLSNSQDALEKVDYKKYIFIDIYTDDNNIILKVKDNAGGIPEKIISKVFEPYVTTKHESQGTGIGLYMIEEIITKNLNGTIEVKNKDFNYDGISYKGAEFTIILDS